jgi:hypothetical protein
MATADLDEDARARENGKDVRVDDPPPAPNPWPVEPATPPQTSELAPSHEPEAPAEPALPEVTGFRWDPAVEARPLGLGCCAQVVVFEGARGAYPPVLVSSCGGRLAQLHRPRESGGFPRVYDAGVPVPGLEGLRCLCPIPGSQPGLHDLVGLGSDDLVLIRNTGTAEAPAFTERVPLGLGPNLGLPDTHVAQMVSVDWDGDGRVDLLVGLDDVAGYWADSPAGIPSAQQVGFNQAGGHPGYDRSGLWRGRAPEGRIRWLKNVGEAGQPRFELQPELGAESGTLDLAPHPAPLAVSWGGGDALELMLADVRGVVKVHRNFGGQRPPVLMEPRTLKSAGAPLVLPSDRVALVAADLDGDGRTELVWGASDGRVFAIRSTSRDSASPPHMLMQEPGPLWLSGHAVVAAGDLDGDGGIDLIFGDAPGHIYWAKDVGQGGDHRYEVPRPLEAGGARFLLDPGPDGRLGGPLAPALGFACPSLTDWNGNGRLDLLVGGAGGEILLLRNDGAVNDPRFARPVAVRCDGAPLITPPRVRPAAAHWLGNPVIDVLALDLQGFLCVYPGRDLAQVGPPVPLVDRLGRVIRLDGGFGLGGHCSLWAGPWAEPGRIDLLVGLPRDSARFVVPALTGETLPVDAPAPTVLLLENHGRLGLVPRVIRDLAGKPLEVGVEGCSPSAVATSGAGEGGLDLLVGSDDGRVHFFRRQDLRW